MKPGAFTSEFWLCGMVASVALAVVLGFVPAERLEKAVGLAVSMLTALGYTLARTSAKRADSRQRTASSGQKTEDDLSSVPLSSLSLATAGPLKLAPGMSGELLLTPDDIMEAPRLVLDAPRGVLVEEILVGEDRIVMGPVKASGYGDGKIMPVVVTKERPMKILVKNETGSEVSVQAGLVADKGS